LLVLIHVYYHHAETILQANEEAHINTILIHFANFCHTFDLIPSEAELWQPLKEMIMAIEEELKRGRKDKEKDVVVKVRDLSLECK